MSETALINDSTRKALIGTAIATTAILLIGLILAPERAWSNLFIATFYLLTVGLGGTVFIALTYVTGGGWQVAFRRVPEALAMIVPVTGAAILFVLALRIREYGWHHHGAGSAGTFWFKEFWLTPSFWMIRSVGYVVIWSLLGSWIVLRSRRPAATEAAALRKLSGNTRLSAIFLAVYAVTFSLASADWLMALDPMWFSTIWGVYNFSGMILASLAVVVILCIQLSATPGRPLYGVFTVEHLHDLGKLLAGFSCFWMYIWFSQYMLIWYSNIPEETSYFIIRMRGAWSPIVAVSIVLNWLIPFFVLLPKPSKRSPSIMSKVACILLLGRWVDLYVMVLPTTTDRGPHFGIWELSGILAIAAIGTLTLTTSFSKAPAVDTTAPYLSESLHYHA